MVLKHTVQLMPGHTVWIDVVGQSQKQVAVNFSVQDRLCTNDATIPEECTELVPAQSRLTVKSTYKPIVHYSTSSDPNNLQIIVPDENIMSEAQCEFADGICGSKTLCRIPLINWGTQPQVFKKGTVIGQLEEARLVEHGDSLWNSLWEEPPKSIEEQSVRMCQVSDRLNQVEKEFKINDQCSDTERRQLLDSLFQHEQVFALCDEELGETDVVEHSIDTAGANPVREAPRRLLYALRKQLEEELDKLLQINCVEPANSPYASPIVLVKKKDGTPRLCVDYRSINKDTVPDRYPLPRVDELIDAIGNQKEKYFSTLDLMRGYHQVKMEDKSKAKTAFICHRGLFQYSRMPFGLTNAPGTFQRLMDELFAGWDFVFISLDNILITSKTFSEHITQLKKVL